jgi:hypothetical protein
MDTRKGVRSDRSANHNSYPSDSSYSGNDPRVPLPHEGVSDRLSNSFASFKRKRRILTIRNTLSDFVLQPQFLVYFPPCNPLRMNN